MRHSDNHFSASRSVSSPVDTMARISSSVNAVTCLAPQNSSSGSRFRNTGFGYSGTHFSGSKTFHSKRPMVGKLGYFAKAQYGGASPSVNSSRADSFQAKRYAPDRGLFGRCVPLPSVDP